MNREKLVEVVMNKINSTKADASRAVEAVFGAITSALIKGDEVTISGFGSFKVAKRAARQGVNPRTGEKIQIAAKSVPKFKAGKALKEAIK